jgi:hypothetical protein
VLFEENKKKQKKNGETGSKKRSEKEETLHFGEAFAYRQYSHISRVADTMIMNVPRLESVNSLSIFRDGYQVVSPSPYSRKRWQINLLTSRIEMNT